MDRSAIPAKLNARAKHVRRSVAAPTPSFAAMTVVTGPSAARIGVMIGVTTVAMTGVMIGRTAEMTGGMIVTTTVTTIITGTAM